MSDDFDQYTQFDHAAAEKQLADAKKGGDSFRLKLAEGKYRLRMLPGKGGESPMLAFWEHSIRLPGDEFAMFTCPLKQVGKPCPACAKSDLLAKGGSEADLKAAKNYAPKKRAMANFIDRAAEAEGPKVWTFGAMKAKGKDSVYERLLFLLTDSDLGRNYVHPVEGFDLIVIRTGKGLDTTYSCSIDERRGALPLSEDRETAIGWLSRMKDLKRLTGLLPVDELEARMRGEKPQRDGNKPTAQDHMDR